MTDRTRDDELRDTPLQKAKTENWPKGVRTIAIKEIDNLGVDAEGRIYWNGKLFKVEKRFSLSIGQKVGAFLITLSAIAASFATAIQGWVMYHEWACKIGIWATLCPIE